VKAQLPHLLKRLALATKESGRMSELADFLGMATGKRVPLASVSRWLSGKREPGGEITLQLLHWVEHQERQK
jgi:outer membrane biogenesis lipoprotein LolB